MPRNNAHHEQPDSAHQELTASLYQIILLPKTKIRTREKAEQLLEKYLSPFGREKNAESIETSLQWLFERKQGQQGNRSVRSLMFFLA